MFANVAIELRHETLTEAHDLVIRLALWVEIGATFATTDRQPGQGILENLFETKELDDAEVDRRVET